VRERRVAQDLADPPDSGGSVGANESPTWTIHDVAHYLRCSTKTVLALVRHEGLPGFRLRSRLRFVPGDVLQWARRRGKEVY
jgi:excisionase family DNA binding protein